MLATYCKYKIQHFKNLLVLLGGQSRSLALLFTEVSRTLSGLPKIHVPTLTFVEQRHTHMLLSFMLWEYVSHFQRHTSYTWSSDLLEWHDCQLFHQE